MSPKILSSRLATVLLLLLSFEIIAAAPLKVGNHRELFVDDYLVDQLIDTRQVLHVPQPQERVLELDRPWEGIYSGYFTVFRDGDKFRMYYRGMPEAKHDFDTEVTCYAESPDGIHWTRPNLGMFNVQGTRENNVILVRHRACSNFAPFMDDNPDAPESQRYKALGGSGKPGLIAFVSPDGIHWKELQSDAVITKGAFDSQNVSFWSVTEQQYICYFRIFVKGVRWISRTTSKDFIHWTEPVRLSIGDKPIEHLYTNQLIPYFRAPHIYLGVPTRFLPGRKVLTDEKVKTLGTATGFDFSKDATDIVLVSSRGGDDFPRRFMEGFIRPGLDQRNWTSRANYAAHGFIQSGPGEISIYVNQNLGYPTSHIRRYALRLDGFASIQAPYSGGEFVTKPLTFSGKQLTINYATSAAGHLRVEIQDAAGQSIPGFTVDDCHQIIGDEIERTVRWSDKDDLAELEGEPVKLRFVMKDADLYSLQFQEPKPAEEPIADPPPR